MEVKPLRLDEDTHGKVLPTWRRYVKNPINTIKVSAIQKCEAPLVIKDLSPLLLSVEHSGLDSMTARLGMDQLTFWWKRRCKADVAAYSRGASHDDFTGLIGVPPMMVTVATRSLSSSCSRSIDATGELSLTSAVIS